jgi:ketosteroid isomerase-like protein
MKRACLALLTALLLFPALHAQVAPFVPAPAGDPDRVAIETLMATQTNAWNRADIPAFMQVYENSPETTFIGLTLRRGYQTILDRYTKAYSTPEQMGKLTFSDLDVRFLPSSCGKVEFAVVTGKFHLARTAHGEAGKDDGIFSLVWRKGPTGWKILLDHTS